MTKIHLQDVPFLPPGVFNDPEVSVEFLNTLPLRLRRHWMRIDFEKYEKMTMELNLGDLMIFNPKLFHRSGSNISNHVRYTNIGMFHDVEYSTFRPPQPSFVYKESSPEAYYSEVFKVKI